MNNTTGKTTDICYQLGGQITYRNGQRQLVVLHVTKDEKDICYHRGIELKEKNSLFDEYFADLCWKVTYQESFPALGTNCVMQKITDQEAVIAQDKLCVKIHDPRLGVVITLFKPQEIHALD